MVWLGRKELLTQIQEAARRIVDALDNAAPEISTQ